MFKASDPSRSLAAAITKAASRQTYYTILFLVDRPRVADAFRAYAYFRWVDDVLDAPRGTKSGQAAFLARQESLLDACYRGEIPAALGPEEQILADLIRHDPSPDSGLHAYLRNMMQVMAFDAGRRGRLIREQDLTEYSRKLALAVTEAMHYFIGHDDASPRDANRYLAVTAAHITHMLRDGREDAELGYTNIPSEYLQARGISPQDSASPAYREWVCGRVQLARMYFRAGRDHLRRVRNLRCRLAGFAYVARFEWMLQVIERDRFCLRKAYPQRKSLSASLWMLGCALSALTASQPNRPGARRLAVQPVRIEPR